MFAIDGNNSLKRIASVGKRTSADVRVFESDYFLPRSFVDGFADEVRSRPVPRNQSDDGPEDAFPESETLGDPTDGVAEPPSQCTDNWKAASSDEKKKMWGVFEETGIFAGACRHGLMLWIADMVRSGEL